MTMSFKYKYEFINNAADETGFVYREIKIPEDHPFKEVSGNDVLRMIENRETFYLYIGDELCPWCRSVLEKFIEVCKRKGIDTVYYIDVYDDDGEEVFRDRYVLKQGRPKMVFAGDQSYRRLLEQFDGFLKEYTLDNQGKQIDLNEKRIYIPCFFYIEEGKTKKMTKGTSLLQKDPSQELSDEILKDEERIFEEFFDNDQNKGA